MDSLGCTDGSQVAVALICENEVTWIQAVYGSSDSRRTSVGSFNPVDVNIIIGEDGTTHRRNAHSAVSESHFFNQFGYEFMNNTVAAARAIVHVIVVHQSRFLINQILRFDNIVDVHDGNALVISDRFFV